MVCTGRRSVANSTKAAVAHFESEFSSGRERVYELLSTGKHLEAMQVLGLQQQSVEQANGLINRAIDQDRKATRSLMLRTASLNFYAADILGSSAAAESVAGLRGAAKLGAMKQTAHAPPTPSTQVRSPRPPPQGSGEMTAAGSGGGFVAPSRVLDEIIPKAPTTTGPSSGTFRAAARSDPTGGRAGSARMSEIFTPGADGGSRIATFPAIKNRMRTARAVAGGGSAETADLDAILLKTTEIRTAKVSPVVATTGETIKKLNTMKIKIRIFRIFIIEPL